MGVTSSLVVYWAVKATVSVLEEMMFVIVHCVLMEGSGGCGVI